MSYIFPSATINNMIFTAKRWGQFPTITYTAGATAGHEVVTIASNLGNITIQIADGVSTNLQIKTAILASGLTVNSLMARDLVDISIVAGHNSDANSTVSATSMSGGVSTPPPTVLSSLYLPPVPSVDEVLQADPSGKLEWVSNAVVSFPLEAPSDDSIAYGFDEDATTGMSYDGSTLKLRINDIEAINIWDSVIIIPELQLSLDSPGSVTSPTLVLGTGEFGFFQDTDKSLSVSYDNLGTTNKVFAISPSVVAGDTLMMLWDVTKGTLSRVSVGADDSAGTGYKVLRIPN